MMNMIITTIILLGLLGAAPARAANDALKMGEGLSTTVVKKADAKAVKPADPPKSPRTAGGLEIEVRKEQKTEVKK